MDYSEKPDRHGVLHYTECAPDFWCPAMVTVEGIAPGLETPPGSLFRNLEYRVRATLDLWPVTLHYAFTEIHLSTNEREAKAWDTGAELTIDTETYRALRLLDIKGGIGSWLGLTKSQLPESARLHRPLSYEVHSDDAQDDKLIAAARIYAAGRLSGRRPQKDVSERLEVSIATAGRWVRKAVDYGYLHKRALSSVDKDN